VLERPNPPWLAFGHAATGQVSLLFSSLRSSSRASAVGHASAVVLLYYAFYTCFFSIALLDGRVLAPGEGFVFYGPAFYGDRALWTTDLFAGFPVAADPQSMTWYPVAWLFGLFPGSLSWFAISAYVLGSSFTYAYLYTVTGSRLAAAVGGLTYGGSGFFSVRLGHLSLIHVAAWLPAIIWTLENLARSPGRGWMAAFAISITTAATAGHTQLFFYSLVVAASYAFIRGWGVPCGWLRYYSLTFSASILGVAMAAVLLLPSYELLAESVRSSLTFDYFSGFALPWRQLPQLAFPFLFGGSGLVEFYSYPAYFGDPHSNHVESTGFVGLVPPVLALGGLWLARRSALAWVWVTIAVITLLLALGDATPLARLMFHVPVYDLFRSHGRLLMIVTFAFAVLAGLGTAAIQRAVEKDRIRAFLFGALPTIAIVATVAIGLLVFADTYRWWAQTRAGVTDISVLPWENTSIGVPLAMLAVGLTALWIWIRRPGPWASVLLLVVVVLDLGSFSWFGDWRYSPEGSDYDRPAQLIPFQRELASSGQRLIPLKGVVQPVKLAPPCVSRLWGLPSASGCNPFITKRYSSLTGMDSAGLLTWSMLNPDNAVLDILAVRYVFVPELPVGSPETQLLAADPARWRRAQDLPFGSAYSNERALPRAWLANDVITLTPDQVLSTIQHSTLPDGRKFDPRTTALVEQPLDFADQSPGHRGNASLIRQADSSLAVQVDTDSPAFLVLSDAYYPGWRATVDGNSSYIYRTDYTLRGILVPRGSHVVQFEYRPKSFFVGASVSAASALILIMLLAWPLLRKAIAAAGAAPRRALRPRVNSTSRG
jgi:Bacterial membrane protein YfhO